MLHEEPTKKREQISMVSIDELVPQNHLLRKIDRVQSWYYFHVKKYVGVYFWCLLLDYHFKDIERKSLYFALLQPFIPAFDGSLGSSIQNGFNNCLLKPFCLRFECRLFGQHYLIFGTALFFGDFCFALHLIRTGRTDHDLLDEDEQQKQQTGGNFTPPGEQVAVESDQCGNNGL